MLSLTLNTAVNTAARTSLEVQRCSTEKSSSDKTFSTAKAICTINIFLMNNAATDFVSQTALFNELQKKRRQLCPDERLYCSNISIDKM